MESFKNCGEYINSLSFEEKDGWGDSICFDDLAKSCSDYGLIELAYNKYKDVMGNIILIENQDDYYVDYPIVRE